MKKKMTKLCSISLAVLMAATAAGCGSDSPEQQQKVKTVTVKRSLTGILLQNHQIKIFLDRLLMNLTHQRNLDILLM